MRRCNTRRDGIETRTNITSLPVSTDSQPRFADMLHYIQTSNGGLPENLPIGGTHTFSYMLYVRDRMNILRAREGNPSLGPKSLLGTIGYQDSANIDSFISCTNNYFGNDFRDTYLFIYPSCEYNPDNQLFFSRFIAICNSNLFDFINSWSWEREAAGNFQSRIEALEQGDVPGISLNDLQTACYSPNGTITPTPTPAAAIPGDLDNNGTNKHS